MQGTWKHLLIDSGIGFTDNLSIGELYLDKSKGRVSLKVLSSMLITPSKQAIILEKLNKELDGKLDLEIKIDPNAVFADVLSKSIDEIMLYICEKHSALSSFGKALEIKSNDSEVIVKFLSSASEVIWNRENASKSLINWIAEFCDVKVKVNTSLDYESISNAKQNAEDEYKNSHEQPAHSVSGSNNNARALNSIGKPNNRAKVSSISELRDESGNVKIMGEVCKIETRDTFDKSKTIYKFILGDENDSVYCSYFAIKGSAEDKGFSQFVKIGSKFEIQGETYSNKYTGFETELNAYYLTLLESSSECSALDTCENKRVELHLHTNMSAMDALGDINDIVKRAAEWGHSAIAVTDHGVVQAYPSFYSAAKKHGIKAIFGIEGYLYDDCNLERIPEDQVFVVFDLETTGLSSKKDSVIEIGAVKMQYGKVIDRFASLANPGRRLSAKIVEITGIEDSMLANAPMSNVVLADFAEFCRDSVLVGHNATGFDMKFIFKSADEFDLTFPERHIDTLTLSRALLRDHDSHKLNDLTEHFGVELVNHHRAVDDAEATAQIFLKLCELWLNTGADGLPVSRKINVDTGKKKNKSHHIVILVKNQAGLRNLYELVSLSHLRHFRRTPRIPRSLLLQLGDGLMLGSACVSGELYRKVVDNLSDDKIFECMKFYDYVEVQPVANNMFLVEEGLASNADEIRTLNKRLVDLAEKAGKTCVATGDVHYIDKKDDVYRRIIMQSQGFADGDYEHELYYKTTDEMLEEFAYLGREKALEIVVDNTNRIAEECEMLTPFPLETCQPEIEGAEEKLIDMCYERAKSIYGVELPEEVESRLKREIDSITTHKFSSLYMIACMLVEKSNKEGYLVGSRGSVGSSVVAFLMGITEVNALEPHYVCPSCKFSNFDISDITTSGCGIDLPNAKCPTCGNELKKDGYSIPFETFLGFDGDKVPDIDLNFSGEYQPVAHKYTEELFGKGHVYRAGTISDVQEKTAYGFVMKYFEAMDLLPKRAHVDRLAAGCCGVKRTTGQHPGGQVVVPSDRSIYEFTPLQYPADRREAGSITTHFDFNSMHDTLVKLDILGHDDPTMIRSLQEYTGVDPTTIPLDDPKTMEIYSGVGSLGVDKKELRSAVGTYGVPEFGTNFVRRMLVDTSPTTMEELVRISGLSHGTDVWTNNAQNLVKNGTVTLGEAICTRDDIMNYLIQMQMDKKTAFNIMENVRKGKGLDEGMLQAMKQANIPAWYISSCQKIKYMFPRAHAAAYVMMSYRIAFCKVHHPLAYYASYFSIRGDAFDIAEAKADIKHLTKRIREIESAGNSASNTEKALQTVLEVVLEMKLRGFDFAPIDIMKSHASKFEIFDKKTLLPPLDVISGLGKKASQSIVDAREEGSFKTHEEITQRTSVGKSGLELLVAEGCIADLPASSQMSLF